MAWKPISIVRVGMGKQRSFTVWVFEMLGEAIGTSLWMAALAFAFLKAPVTRNDLSPRQFLGITAVMLIEFALSGYLLTTLLSALYLPRSNRFLYPSMSAGLYLVHSSIFFVGAGNYLLDKQDLSLQIVGACVAFALTSLGDRLRGS